MTPFQKFAKKQVEEIRDFFPDRVIYRRDGRVVFRKNYFYPHGMTAEKWADTVLDRFPSARLVSSDDNWNPWPKDSFFEAVIESKDPDENETRKMWVVYHLGKPVDVWQSEEAAKTLARQNGGKELGWTTKFLPAATADIYDTKLYPEL